MEETKYINARFIEDLLRVEVCRYLRNAIKGAGIDEVLDSWDISACTQMMLHGGRTDTRGNSLFRHDTEEIRDMEKLDRAYLGTQLYDNLRERKKDIVKYPVRRTTESAEQWDEIKSSRKDAFKTWKYYRIRTAWSDVDDIREMRNALIHFVGPNQMEKGSKEATQEERNLVMNLEKPEGTFRFFIKIIGVLDRLGQRDGVAKITEKFRNHYLIENRYTYNWIPRSDFFEVFSGRGQIQEWLVAKLADSHQLRDGKVNLTEQSFGYLREAEAEWREKSAGWEDTEPYDLSTLRNLTEGSNVFVTKSVLMERGFSDVCRNYLLPLYQERQTPFFFLTRAYNELLTEYEELYRSAPEIPDDNERHAQREAYRFLRSRCKQIKEMMDAGICSNLKPPYENMDHQTSQALLIPVAYMIRAKAPLVLITQDSREAKILYDLFYSVYGTKGITFLRIQNGKLCGNTYYEE